MGGRILSECAIKVTEFERRQMAALREELDNEYDDHIGLQKRPSEEKPQANLSSKNRTCALREAVVCFCR